MDPVSAATCSKRPLLLDPLLDPLHRTMLLQPGCFCGAKPCILACVGLPPELRSLRRVALASLGLLVLVLFVWRGLELDVADLDESSRAAQRMNCMAIEEPLPLPRRFRDLRALQHEPSIASRLRLSHAAPAPI